VLLLREAIRTCRTCCRKLIRKIESIDKMPVSLTPRFLLDLQYPSLKPLVV
jgi:hypothetical protein